MMVNAVMGRYMNYLPFQTCLDFPITYQINVSQNNLKIKIYPYIIYICKITL